MADKNQQPGSTEKKEDFGEGPSASVGMYLAEIRAYEATFKTWLARAEKIVERYRDEAQDQDDDFSKPANKFAVLWSNVQTLQPVVYAQAPKPDIQRRHKDRDAVARASAIILERAVEAELETCGFDEAMTSCRDDYLLTARGQSWWRYIPEYGPEEKEKIYLQQATDEAGQKIFARENGEPFEGEPQFDEDGQPFMEGEPFRPVVRERAECSHIPWKDFGHTPAPRWGKVRIVWKREYLTRDQMVERFGKEKGAKVDMLRSVEGVSEQDKLTYGDTFKRAEVYEIWDKSTGKVVWISPGFTEGPLDERTDPLGLEEFFPCPRPLFGTLTTDSLVPIPDYSQYRAQAEEIDKLTQRIAILTKALKVAGAYNGELTELQRILDTGDNTLVPIDNWQSFAEAGGLEGSIAFLPMAEVASVLVQLIQMREQMKRDLFEVTGLSDLMRGQGQASETATAQRIKGHFAGMRVESRQRAMARFARDNIRICAELMAELFSPETLLEMSGWLHTEEAEALDAAHDAWMTAQMQARQEAAMQMSGGATAGMGEAPQMGAMEGMPVPPEAMGAMPPPAGMPGPGGVLPQ
jgi:hypothetical protein